MSKKSPKPCGVLLERDRWGEPDEDGAKCAYLRAPAGIKCRWHWLLRQHIEIQITAAKQRRRDALKNGVPERARVKPEECPPNERWCAGCQSFVPLFYTSGSRCRACSSQANHASHVRRTYGMDPEEYQRLLEWQGGRCYICQKLPRVRRLAVDHDHRTGEVRGLLCANDEWGCNVSLRLLLNDVEMARRALAYVEISPLERMRGALVATATPPAGDWDPWND